MNIALPAAMTEIPEGLVDSMPVNEKDRHVLALAVHVGAPIIVTSNLRDFPHDLCGQYEVEALSADVFLARHLPNNATELLSAIEAMAARRRRPPKTVDDILDRLQSELPLTVSLLRSS